MLVGGQMAGIIVDPEFTKRLTHTASPIAAESVPGVPVIHIAG